MDEEAKNFNTYDEYVGNKGSPCLIPLKERKGSSLPPLKRTYMEEVETQFRMSFMRRGWGGGILKRVSISLIKFQSSLS